MRAPPRTVRGAFEGARAAFRAAGLDSPELDARVLVAEVAGFRPLDLVLRGGDALGVEQADKLHRLVERRLAREPVARLLGRREFHGFDLALGPATLVPRPETELLVEVALDWLGKAGALDRQSRLADLGTGSGAIAIAILRACPGAVAVAVDRDASALAVAAANARDQKVGDRFHPVQADWGDMLRPGAFDLIASNPPYVAATELAALEPEVRLHDPRLALDGGPDGLEAYRVLLPGAARALRPGGMMLLEIGEDQSAAVTRLTTAAGLHVERVRTDLSGQDRLIQATR